MNAVTVIARRPIHYASPPYYRNVAALTVLSAYPRNQTLSCGPAVIPVGSLERTRGDSVTIPSVVIRAILLAPNSEK